MIAFALATRDDDAGIRRLLATTAMPGPIRVRFEREPDYFAGCGPETIVLVAKDGAHVVGVACRTMHPLYINGSVENVGYLGQLRIDPQYRGRLLTARGYRVMRELHERRPARGYYTTIVDGNAEAEGVLVRRARGAMPRYRFVEKLHTLALNVGRASARPRNVGRASARPPRHGRAEARPTCHGRAEARPTFPNLFPAYAAQGEIVTVDGGSAALLDQRPFKQTVIDGYAPALALARPLYNLFARIPLPRAGSVVNHAYVTHFRAEDGHAADALIAALRHAAAAKGLDHILLGFTASDPLLAVARRAKPLEYVSSIYTVAFADGDDFHDRLHARPRALDISAL